MTKFSAKNSSNLKINIKDHVMVFQMQGGKISWLGQNPKFYLFRALLKRLVNFKDFFRREYSKTKFTLHCH